ncbi:activating transcription factor 7-interacting protein 1 [Galleria mellonella]|uniref:Activating transcription factor 7-interacting protein 1 n=1 Tax=Galleria mellonella TaxID=7137 RepID=A0A6J1X033_GALME|nr:activating transcription factor 7-interacting protein 1 [Galleria mellonella]XP_026762653.2 activating transcription factor 7-interacting protein 1 [Galleria mellonella]
MQLILDTEPSIDVKRNMSALNQEPLGEQIENVIQNLKNDISNGNKENIETQSNVIIGDNKDPMVENDKTSDNDINATFLPLVNESSKIEDIDDITKNENNIKEILQNIEEKSTVIDEEANSIVVTQENELGDIEGNGISIEKKSNICLKQEQVVEEKIENTSKEQINNDSSSTSVDDTRLEENKSNDIELDEEIIVKETVKVNGPVTDQISNEQIDEIFLENQVNKIETDSEIMIKGEPIDNNEPVVDDKIEEISKEQIYNKQIDVISLKENKIEEIASEDDKVIQNSVEDNEKNQVTINNDNSNKEEDILMEIDSEEEDICIKDVTMNEEDSKKHPSTEKDNNKIAEFVMEEDNKIETINQEGAGTISISKTNENTEVENVNFVMEVDNKFETTNQEVAGTISISKTNENTEVENVNSEEKQLYKASEEIIVAMDTVTSREQGVISIKLKDSEQVFESETDDNKEKVFSNTNVDEINKVDVVQEDKISSQDTKLTVTQEEAKDDTSVTTSVLKLSNTLDILSDEEDEPPTTANENNNESNPTEKQCINIDDDDDIMVIEDANSEESKNETSKAEIEAPHEVKSNIHDIYDKTAIRKTNVDTLTTEHKTIQKLEGDNTENSVQQQEIEKVSTVKEAVEEKKPLVPDNFLKTYKKSLNDMTRDDLEEFCILKIVESIVDRSNLSEIKAKLKTLTQNVDEYKKKVMMLTKQNRDLQVVLKSVQEEQKKKMDTIITPLKITRSVGMQVLMTEKPGIRRKPLPSSTAATLNNNNNSPNTRSGRLPIQSPRTTKQTAPLQIPVPRLVPASNSAVVKTPSPISQITGKTVAPLNGVKNPSPAQKPEKRPHNKVQMSVTVDLTDDEPPSKITTRSSPATPPVRLVPPQNLMAPQRHQLSQSSPRKVYIPISGPQGNIRPGQTIMLKSAPTQNPRPRGPAPQLARMPQNQVRISRVQSRHPAPLPDAMKQYQPPHWKALPPAPDLKLSKVENGIVISWKIEGYLEDSYEEIASYQLYAYQETSSPPSTALWKKIGDVKALPLPMACTLTQFMAGFKYYFAVRAVDIRSRLGPFSLPGSILLLNKM